MKTWYELTPLDTLFFRGSEPMEAGQSSAVPLFPPPTTVIQGALRTALLRERGVTFADYKQSEVTGDVIDLIGRCGDEAPFSVTALLLKRDGILYSPAPASWFIDAGNKPESAGDYVGKQVITALSTADDAAGMGIVSSSGPLSLVVARNEAMPLTGCWVTIALLAQDLVTFGPGDLLTGSELFTTENRIGIGIDSQRKVVEGKLYSANHIRLRDGVTMLVATDKNMGLAGPGLLQLGGEQRTCRYDQVSQNPVFKTVAEPKGYVCLAPLAANREKLSATVAAHKLSISAGWDLSKGFHKPSATWFPAGSVFTENLNNACIPLAL